MKEKIPRKKTVAIYPELFALTGNTVPDLRGLFLRGYGQQSHTQNNGSIIGITSTIHASGELGMIQGDAIRNIEGEFSYNTNMDAPPIGVFGYTESFLPRAAPSNLFTNFDNPVFDASRIVPTAEENRPVNKAVRYLIRARP